MADVEAIYKHLQGTDTEVTALQQIRELVYAVDVSGLKYIDCDSNSHYFISETWNKEHASGYLYPYDTGQDVVLFGGLGVKTAPFYDWKKDAGGVDYCAIEFSKGSSAKNASIFSYNGTVSILNNAYYSESSTDYMYFGAGFANRLYMTASNVSLEAAATGASGSAIDWDTHSTNKFFISSDAGTVFNQNVGDHDFTVHATGALTNALYVRGIDGFVGIGTSTPSALVEIRKDQNTGTLALIKNDTAGTSAYSALDLQSNSCEGVLYCFDDGYTGNTQWPNKLVLHSDSNANGLILSAQNGKVELFTEGTGPDNKRMTVDSTRVDMLDSLAISGTLGVGIDSPTGNSLIEVRKDINAGISVRLRNDSDVIDSYAGYIVQSSVNDGTLIAYNDANSVVPEYSGKVVLTASSTATSLGLTSVNPNGMFEYYIGGNTASDKVATLNASGLGVGMVPDSPLSLAVPNSDAGFHIYDAYGDNEWAPGATAHAYISVTISGVSYSVPAYAV